MPRQLAFLLCSIFVFVLLKYDRKKSVGISWVSWLPTLWMLNIATRSLDTWLGVKTGGRMEGGSLDPIFHVALLVGGLIILNQRKFSWSKFIKENIWLGLLIGFMLVSIFWSDIVFISFKRWVRELTAVVMALLIFTEARPLRAIESVLRRTTYVLIPFSVLLIKYYLDLGVGYSPWTGDMEWVGVTAQKNALGRLCLVSIFFLVWTFVRRWRKRDSAVNRYHRYGEFVVLVMAFWLLKGPSMWAASATGIVSLTAGLVMLFALLWMQKHRVHVPPPFWTLLAAGLIVLGIVTPLVGGATVSGFTGVVGRNSTLTGRTDIWASLLPDLMERPLVGFGFGGFWTLERSMSHRIGEAHNGYLEVVLGIGIVGLFLTTMMLITWVRQTASLLSHHNDWAIMALCFLMMSIIHNVTESSFDSFTKQIFAVVIFLSICRRQFVGKEIGAISNVKSKSRPAISPTVSIA